MVKLQFGLNQTGKLAFQPSVTPGDGRGKLSFCLCCCENLNLINFWLHFIPVDNMCGDFSLSQGESAEFQWISAGSCDDWEYSNEQLVAALLCFDPTAEGEGPAQLEFDTNARLYCTEINKFRLDLCFSNTTTDPQFPDDCINLLLGLLGTQISGLDICDIAEAHKDDPGYVSGTNPFVIDFGEVTFSLCGDGCDFRVVINDLPTPPVLASLPPGVPAIPSNQDPLPSSVREWLESGNT